MQKSSMDSGSGIWNDVSHQPGLVRERGLVSKNEADCNFDVRRAGCRQSSTAPRPTGPAPWPFRWA